MEKFKNILVPIDFSNNSLAALQYASEFLKPYGANIHLLHAYQLEQRFYEDEPQNFLRILTKDLKVKYTEKLQQFAAKFLLNENQGGFNYIAMEGNITPSIMEAAKEVDADLIIMGTSGIGNNLFYGSTAREIVSEAAKPVLVIPPGTVFTGLHKIIYATDYNFSDLNAIGTLANLIAPFDGELLLVHISDKNPEEEASELAKFKKLIESRVEGINISFQNLHRKNITETIELLAETHNADMVSMTTQKRNSFMDKVFNKSLTKEMALYSRVPLFAFVKQMPA
jgi:nucleotide-binding universal stress UspA family protein